MFRVREGVFFDIKLYFLGYNYLIMCRLAAITSSEYFSPMENVLALETMKEGHDGSGMGIMLKDLGESFEELKEYPILSGICSESGLEIVDKYMESHGFQVRHVWSPSITEIPGIRKGTFIFAEGLSVP